MRVAEMNWMQMEQQVARDDRCVFPLGSPLEVPVYPATPYGLAPYFAAYPGTVSLRVETLLAVARDVLVSMYRTGFRRILMVNGHGGNNPVGALALELMTEYPDLSVKLRNWWNAPQTLAKVQAIDPLASHASWMENFPWTRLAHAPAPAGRKPQCDMTLLKASPPAEAWATGTLPVSTRKTTPSWPKSGRWGWPRPARSWRDPGPGWRGRVTGG